MAATSVFMPTAAPPVTRPAVFARLYSLGLAVLILVGFGLRLYLLDQYPFREDEAIYSFWALHFWHVDPMFLTVWPDKPPVFLGLLAATFRLFGFTQASGRWLNILLSTATIPIVAVTARYLWDRRTALVVALAFSLSPFAISFAPTVYTDPLLVFAGSLALYLALTDRAFWAGLWLGLAIMTKQQGLLYLPLVLGLLLHHHLVNVKSLRSMLRPVGGFLAGLGAVVLPILYWDSLRWAVAPSPWDLSVRNYGALAVAPVLQWPQRLAAWMDLGWYLTASWWVWTVLGILLAWKLLQRDAAAQRRNWDLKSLLAPFPLMLFWSLGFCLLHEVSTVQIWDRYVLPLAPMLALMIGWLVNRIHPLLSARGFVLLLLVGTLCLLPPALLATTGQWPIGADHGDYTGLTDALTWLTHEQSQHVVLYHRLLGWQYRFYLYNQVAAGDYELRWFPSAVYLADNATKAPLQRKFFLQPSWSPMRDLKMHLAVRGLTLTARQHFGKFTLYEIKQLPQPFCTWCSCAPHNPWTTLKFASDQSMMSRQ
ncbi:MAG: glycosyltransferase family 39 protein [Chloroflexi bacterium]|nr:glycosyltransferase family 39 protein [Chloroflexota bacterium]